LGRCAPEASVIAQVKWNESYCLNSKYHLDTNTGTPITRNIPKLDFFTSLFWTLNTIQNAGKL
jgi:hypothetical protein